jgi:hypothetical protein
MAIEKRSNEAIDAMTTEELVARLKKADPAWLRAALEEELIELGLTNADLWAIYAAAFARRGPVRH